MAKKFGYNKYRLKLAQILLPPANEVCQGYVFTRECHSVHGRGVVSKRALQISSPTPRGEVEGSGWGDLQAHTQGEVEGSCQGGSRPTPRGKVEGSHQGGSPVPHPGGVLQAHTWGGVSRPTPRGVCIPACTEADTPPPPSRWLLLRAVRILLECILVN